MNVGLFKSVIETLRPGPRIIPVDVKFITQAAAFAANDVLAVNAELSGACLRGKPSVLIAYTLRDSGDATAAAIDVYLHSQIITLGALNAAITVTDLDAAFKLWKISHASTAWQDLINSKQIDMTWLSGGPWPVRATGEKTESIYASLVSVDGTTPGTIYDYTATFWFLQGQ